MRRAGSHPGAWWPALAAAVAFVVLAGAAAFAWEASDRQVTDVALYRTYGERVAGGDVPYRDFRLEYPPGALPVVVVPALLTSSADGYRIALGTLLALVGALGILVVALARGTARRPGRETALVLGALALSPLALGALLLDRFDLLPAALTALVVLALVGGRDRLGAVLLGVAIAVKLYPVVLLPLAVVWAIRRKGTREGAVVAAIAAAVTALAYLPFALVAPEGVATSVGRQLGRPLQIESLGSGVLLALHHVAGIGLDWRSSHGSQNLTGAAADALALALFLAQVAVLVWLWSRFARGAMSGDRLVLHAVGAVTAFVAFGKVISPQFLIWPLFLVALLTGRRLWLAGGLYALACALTAIWFPARYWSLVKEFDPLASFLVLTRDVVLVLLLLAIVWPMREARRPESARSPMRAPTPGRT